MMVLDSNLWNILTEWNDWNEKVPVVPTVPVVPGFKRASVANRFERKL
jgi:hypothetical protein